MRLSRARFEDLSHRAAQAVLNTLPPDLRAEAEDVILEVADWPSTEQLDTAGLEPGDTLLGLYEGVPLVYRRPDSVIFQPDTITLFQGPLETECRTEEELRRRIRKTIIHELGHFFGFSEDELAERGWE